MRTAREQIAQGTASAALRAAVTALNTTAYQSLPEYDPGPLRPSYYSVMNKSQVPPSGDKHDFLVSTSLLRLGLPQISSAVISPTGLRELLLALQRRMRRGRAAPTGRPLRAVLHERLPRARRPLPGRRSALRQQQLLRLVWRARRAVPGLLQQRLNVPAPVRGVHLVPTLRQQAGQGRQADW